MYGTYVELGGIPVLVVTQGIDFIPVLFFRIPVYPFLILIEFFVA